MMTSSTHFQDVAEGRDVVFSHRQVRGRLPSPPLVAGGEAGRHLSAVPSRSLSPDSVAPHSVTPLGTGIWRSCIMKIAKPTLLETQFAMAECKRHSNPLVRIYRFSRS